MAYHQYLTLRIHQHQSTLHLSLTFVLLSQNEMRHVNSSTFGNLVMMRELEACLRSSVEELALLHSY